MKFVFASERGRLVKERQQYTEKYNADKAAYTSQRTAYEQATEQYREDIKEFVSAFLANELAQLPEISLEVKEAPVNKDRRYYIYLTYSSNKARSGGSLKWADSDYSFDLSSGRLRGFNWNLTIYLTPYRNEDGTYKVSKEPHIEADVLDANDYSELKATYDLFAKIETIDWNAVITHICNSAPDMEAMITTKNPGTYSTYKWDNAIDQFNLSRVVGKDIWVRVKINREESYDRYNSNNAGVDDHGWVKINSQTDKFYIFNWLGDRYNLREKSRTYNVSAIQTALRREYRLKKTYFKPLNPLQYATTEDLIYNGRDSGDYSDDARFQ